MNEEKDRTGVIGAVVLIAVLLGIVFFATHGGTGIPEGSTCGQSGQCS